MIRLCLAASAAAFAALATPVFAQDAAPSRWDQWSAGFGAATDNRSKEASKTNGNPFVWGGLEWESDNGLFYAGPGFETIDSNGADVELEVQAGYAPEFAGYQFDLNAAHKWRPGSNPGTDDDAWEFTADMSRSIGPANGRLRLQHSPDGTGSTRAWTWYEARVGWEFSPRISATASIGYREQENAPDYTGWNAGLSYALSREVEFDLRYHATNAEEFGRQYEDAVVAGVSFGF